MSAKGSKGSLLPRKEESEIGSLGKLREGLPEIGHDSRTGNLSDKRSISCIVYRYSPHTPITYI